MNFIDDLICDLRHGSRRLLHAPGFTIVAVLTLGLGIGANTAIFTIVHKALLRQLPIKDPARVVALSNGSPNGRTFPSFSYLNYRDLRDRNRDSIELLAYSP